MRFVVTNESDHNVFYSAPTMAELKKADEDLACICRERLKEYCGNHKMASVRLENELHTTAQAHHSLRYLILKEVADCSRELGYPVLMNDNETLIAFLLGLSYVNPLPVYYRCESCDWYGSYSEMADQRICGFDMPDKYCPKCGKLLGKYGFPPHHSLMIAQKPEMCIAPSVRPHLAKRMNKVFGSIDSAHDAYKCLSVPDADICEEVGNLRQRSSVKSFKPLFSESIYHKVLQRVERDSPSPSQKGIAKELSYAPINSFYLLLRAYGYVQNDVSGGKPTEQVLDIHYCILQDEVENMLVFKGLPEKAALHFCKGLLTDQDKEDYAELKSRYHLQEDEYLTAFEQTKRYFTSCAGANFLYLACEAESIKAATKKDGLL